MGATSAFDPDLAEAEPGGKDGDAIMYGIIWETVSRNDEASVLRVSQFMMSVDGVT